MPSGTPASRSASADGDAHLVGPCGPDAADIHVLRRQRRLHFLAGSRTSSMKQLLSDGVRRSPGSSATRWSRARMSAMFFLRVGTRSGSSRLAFAAATAVMGRAFIPPNGVTLRQQVGPADGESHADARHSVQLREGAQHDDVLAFFHEVQRTRRIAEVDVGLVDQQDRVLGRVARRRTRCRCAAYRFRWGCWDCRCRSRRDSRRRRAWP